MKAFVFPGQGSQAVGMGTKLLAAFSIARETLEEVDDALGQNLTKLILSTRLSQNSLVNSKNRRGARVYRCPINDSLHGEIISASPYR